MDQLASLLGYAASLCLIISLVVTTDLKFRIFNTAGCAFFIIYAIIFEAWPVLITNTMLFGINAWYLFKLFGHKEDFTIIEFSGNDIIMQKFTSLHEADIKKYFPRFSAEQLSGNLNFAVLRDLTVTNIFSLKVLPDGIGEVTVNYTSKKFRDRKVSRFILEKSKDLLLSKGIRRVVYRDMQEASHRRLIESLGFVNENGVLSKTL